MKIFMIVDDSPVIRKVGRRLIEQMGFVVVEVGDGESALQLAASNMPDAAMIDWDLPDISGIEVIRRIRVMEDGSRCRLMYCTSEVLVADMTKAKRAGADGFAMKPFNRTLLEASFEEAGISPHLQVA